MVRLPLLLPTLLLSCAPRLAPHTFTELSGAEQAAICAATPRVGEGGRLLYGPGDGAASISPDYRLDCPELGIRTDAQALTVTAPTLDAALAAFDDSAFFPSYYAELRVRLGDGRVDADPLDSVPENLRAQANAVTVTVTPLGGAAQTLLAGGRITPVTLEPGVTYRVTIRTRGTPNPWPSVTVDPQSGTIEATVGL